MNGIGKDECFRMIILSDDEDKGFGYIKGVSDHKSDVVKYRAKKEEANFGFNVEKSINLEKGEAHLRYPLFYLINLRYTENDEKNRVPPKAHKIIKDLFFPNYDNFVGNYKDPDLIKIYYQLNNDYKLGPIYALIRKKSIDLRNEWKTGAIESFRTAYSEYVRRRLLNEDTKTNFQEDNEGRDFKILPRMLSDDELFMDFVNIFNDPNLFNNYKRYENRKDDNGDLMKNWFKELFEEKKTDHWNNDDGVVRGHRLRILNVRYLDSSAYYDMIRDNGVENRYEEWKRYMAIDGLNRPNKIHEILMRFIHKNKSKIVTSTINSSFVKGKFQKAIYDVYYSPIIWITVSLLFYKFICSGVYLIKVDGTHTNFEKKLASIVKSDNKFLAEDIWCLGYLFNKNNSFKSNNDTYRYDLENGVDKNHIWFDNDDDENKRIKGRYEKISLRLMNQLWSINSNSEILKGIRGFILRYNDKLLKGDDIGSKKVIFFKFLLLLVLFFIVLIIIFFSGCLLYCGVDEIFDINENEDARWISVIKMFGSIVGFGFIFLMIMVKKGCHAIWHYSKFFFSRSQSEWLLENKYFYEKMDTKPYNVDCDSKIDGKKEFPPFSELWKQFVNQGDPKTYSNPSDSYSYFFWTCFWWVKRIIRVIILYVVLFFWIVIWFPLKQIFMYIYLFFYISDNEDDDFTKKVKLYVICFIILMCIWLLKRVLDSNKLDKVNSKVEKGDGNELNVKRWETYLISGYPEWRRHIDSLRYSALFGRFEHYSQNVDSNGEMKYGAFLFLAGVVLFYVMMYIIQKVSVRLPRVSGLNGMEPLVPIPNLDKSDGGIMKYIKGYKHYILLFIIFVLVFSIWAVEHYAVYKKFRSDMKNRLENEIKKRKDDSLEGVD